MKHVKFSHFLRTVLTAGLISGSLTVQAQAVSVADAEALLLTNKCAKCHSVDKKKDGPPFKETAAKYKGKADAEAKVVKHITTGPKIKIDGIEEDHQIVKTKDEAEILNLVRYILSR